MTDEEIKYLSRSECATLLHSDKGYGGLSSAEFWEEGYKKGLAEGKPKWHDFKKDPNDRPIQDCDIALKVYDYRTKTIISDIGFFRKKQDMFYHYKSACKIISWCQLPDFEEPKP
ncbi:MAG: hypothetical protein MJ196_07575 [Treponemataceae bacterium]|nr:hypothetical protein [Treponemataceae bacterium]